MPMTVHVLGAAGWIPGVNETSCIMVENKGSLFILDAGTGSAQTCSSMNAGSTGRQDMIVTPHSNS